MTRNNSRLIEKDVIITHSHSRSRFVLEDFKKFSSPVRTKHQDFSGKQDLPNNGGEKGDWNQNVCEDWRAKE